MDRGLVQRNRMTFIIMAVLLVLFAAVVYVGAYQLYKAEVDRGYKKATYELASSQKIIELAFHTLKSDLFFLYNAPDVRRYVNSDFNSVQDEKEVEQYFYHFARSRKQYYQLCILDAKGDERIRVNNAVQVKIAAARELQNQQDRYYFKDAMKMDEGQFYISPIDLNIEHGKVAMPYEPVVRFAMPLYDTRHVKKGILIINARVVEILKLLPRDIVLQTEEKNLISLLPNGVIGFQKSDYQFKSDGTALREEKVISLYMLARLLNQHKVALIVRHDINALKILKYNFGIVFILLFLMFLFLMFLMGYLNYKDVKHIVRSKKALIFGLAQLAEKRDLETGQHLARVGEYVVTLANELRKNRAYRRIITRQFLDDLYDAAPLHDIGKTAVPDALLQKEAHLTPSEFEEMKKHVAVGADMLQALINGFDLKDTFLVTARNICRYHHEKYDGTGYLLGLSQREIPLAVRIFTLCDVYDALRSKRYYKEPWSHDDAVKEIQKEYGKYFDPAVVDAFMRCEKLFKEISERDLKM